MKKIFINDFNPMYKDIHKDISIKLCENIEKNIKGITIGAHVCIRDPNTHYSPFKIFKVKNFGFDENVNLYGSYFYIDDKNNKYYTADLKSLNIDEILDYLNKNKPEVSFRTLERIKIKKENFFKKIKKFFKKKDPWKLNVGGYYFNEKNINTHINKIGIVYGMNERDEDKLYIIDDKMVDYLVNNPYTLEIIIRTEIDPYGEEIWDD